MIKKSISAAILVSAIAIPLSAGAELVNENLLVAVPAGYKIDFRAKKGNALLNEMVPSAESVHNWTEMVTVQIFYNLKVTPQLFRARTEKFWAAACPNSHFNSISNENENGYPVLVWRQTCALNKTSGKPEFTWFKAIEGNDAFYVVQKAFKFEPTKEQSAIWVQYLKTIVVCDSRLPDRRCPLTH